MIFTVWWVLVRHFVECLSIGIFFFSGLYWSSEVLFLPSFHTVFLKGSHYTQPTRKGWGTMLLLENIYRDSGILPHGGFDSFPPFIYSLHHYLYHSGLNEYLFHTLGSDSIPFYSFWVNEWLGWWLGALLVGSYAPLMGSSGLSSCPSCRICDLCKQPWFPFLEKDIRNQVLATEMSLFLGPLSWHNQLLPRCVRDKEIFLISWRCQKLPTVSLPLNISSSLICLMK